MILQNKSIIGPFLNKKGKLWSNFWGDIDEGGWYKDSFDYKAIVNKEFPERIAVDSPNFI